MPANSDGSMLILIAGPYRSGTNDDPALMRKNVQDMESYALPIFRAGHIPIVGEWLALPLVDLAGSRKVGDPAFNEVFHPIAIRLLEKCDAVLRVGGPSAGADGGPGVRPRRSTVGGTPPGTPWVPRPRSRAGGCRRRRCGPRW